MNQLSAPFDDEGILGVCFPSPQSKILPPDLQPYLDSLKELFRWLQTASNSEAAKAFADSMANSGGSLSNYMLELLQAKDQEHWPWSFLNDAYAMRTVADKVSRWLAGDGYTYCSELKFLGKLRGYHL